LEDPAMLLIDRLYFFWVFVGILLPGLFVGVCTRSWIGFFSGMIWGGFVRICLMQHVTWSINSVCHVWGGRPFRTADHSANNWICAVLALGEGWHNNHHAFPTSARQGLRWWQFDSSWLIIRAMNLLGLAREVRTPTKASMEIKRRSASPVPSPSGRGSG
jgi:stearoyl-CoA desaturase (delta-9 desaturase)